VLNLVFGVDATLGDLANTSVGFYLYPREITKLSEGFVLYLYQLDRKLGMTWHCVNFDTECVGKVFLDMLTKSDYLLFYSFMA
jgi:hypothetical protein